MAFALTEAARIERRVAAYRNVLVQDHLDTLALAEYNLTDIATEAEASARIPELSPLELAYWQDDQRINRRGVAVDIGGLNACIAIVEQALDRYGREFLSITGIEGPTKLQQFTGWLRARGVHTDSLDEDAVGVLLKTELPPDARRALEIRAAVDRKSTRLNSSH